MKKKYVIYIIAIVVIILVSVSYAINKENKKQQILKSISITFNDVDKIEYGAKDLDIKKTIVKKTNGKIKSISNIDTTKIGKQKIIFVVEKEGLSKEVEYTVEVVDTKAPQIFVKEENIAIEVGTSFNAMENIQAVKDDVDGNIGYISLEDIYSNEEKRLNYYTYSGSVDANVVGQYEIVIEAIDKNGNRAEKKFIVEINEKKAETTAIIEVNEDNPSVSNETNKSEIIDLAVPYINQYAAGAPMGCEAAALLEALQYKGNATKYTLSTFLKEMPISVDENPNNGFVSTPYEIVEDDVYQSIYPTPLASWGSRYGTVVNISGASTEELIGELKKGNPVIVYVTYKFETIKWGTYSFGNAVLNAHIVTLCGYNPTTGKYKVSDPAGGIYWVNGKSFEKAYNGQRFSVAVR